MVRLKGKFQDNCVLNKEYEVIITGEEIALITMILGSFTEDGIYEIIENSNADIGGLTEVKNILKEKIKKTNYIYDKYVELKHLYNTLS